jgi:hypothetical protein
VPDVVIAGYGPSEAGEPATCSPSRRAERTRRARSVPPGRRWSIPGTTVSSHPWIRAAASRLAWISGG